MGGKLQGSRGRKPDSAQDKDTTAYEQPIGTSTHGVENGRVPRMPHERDESATATGNRLEESPVPSGKDIDHAVDDLKKGRQDTERKGIPSDVPAPQNSTRARRRRTRSGV